ncbi:terminase large subunit [Escherichia phage vB_EcoP-CHD5UKE1]|uniref:Terminase, large subunit n=1 Tax=Escherichia phage vB_EcoP-CHD5UKE1 TaxID=2865805 RepID=A0ABX9AF99_9CAUD|nr:terminase large subunit [Escherichia phage vB_EcoP-CHD5UKE1]QZI80502.1 terminase large subunit [Escherichia phage vB_EcoP-CHD5UKE1]
MSLDKQIYEALTGNNLSVEEKKALLNMLKERDQWRKYNKILSFKAYDFQKKFYAAGLKHRFRFLCAANRVGKSYSEAYEFACHVTGRYPTWWTGYKFKRPILAWAVGITGDSTRKVLQKELFGTPIGKDTNLLGTGVIPRDAIVIDTIERDGNKLQIVQIKHQNERGEFDGLSTLEFRSTQQGEHTLMGATVDYIWLDEEDPYESMAIFAQCVTRTLTTKGLVTITATPENGLTELVDKFMKGEGDESTGSLYFQNASWWDAHVDLGGHITDQDIKDMTEGIPAWQLEMRSKGMPLLGSGLIYDVSDDTIKCEPFEIPDTWKRVCAIDIGIDHPTAAVWTAYDANTDTIYVYDSYKEGGFTPVYHAPAINGRGQWIPVILPHDADNIEKGSGSSVAQFYKNAGVNVQSETFYNKIGMDGKKNFFVEPGITDIRERMMSGRFKIFNTAANAKLFEEKARYHRKVGKIIKEHDDLMDAMRYSACSVTHRGRSKHDVSYGSASLYEANVSRWNQSY